MTAKQTAQVAVQKAILAVMEKNQSKWQEVTELKNKYEQFNRNLARIEEYESVLQTDLAPLKEKKMKSVKSLVEQLFPVSSVLGVFAFDIGNSKLGKLAGVKFSELEEMGSEELVKYGNRILNRSATLLEQTREEGNKRPKRLIAEYGLTTNHLEKLRGAMDNCTSDESRYATARLEKRKVKVKLDLRIRENNQLLKKRIDRMIHLFRDSQKTFYNAYIKARLPAETPPGNAKEAPPGKAAEAPPPSGKPGSQK